MKDEDVTPIAADIVDDNITLIHPLLPGVEVVQPRASLPSLAEVGWAELKSPTAPAAAKPIPEGDATLKEGTK